MASPEASQAPQSITIRISTTAPILDLSLSDPFVISLETTLNASHPITFKRRPAPLFNGLLQYEGGLTYTNIRTGARVARPTMHALYIPGSTLPNEEEKNRWMTVYPGQPHILEVKYAPKLKKPAIAVPWGTTTAEMNDIQSRQIAVTKWRFVRGFEDGQTYEIGISEGAVSTWMQGSLESILEMRKAGVEPELYMQDIPFEVVQSAQFTVKRPDEDGSLTNHPF